MKKLLLIAALAAIAFGASADGYKIEKVWELNDMTTLLGDRMEVRQGFGMDGKFYINNKKQVFDTVAGVYTTVPTIYEIDENGLTGVTFPGGKNCGITRDEAGNIIVSLAPFSLSWIEAGIRVIDPATGEYKDYMIPEEIAIIGRSDFLGFAKGNLMEEGELWMTGTNQGTGFTHLAIADGEVDMDNCYYMVGSGVTPSTSTVINYYTDLNGDDALLYVTRNDHPRKLAYADDQYTSSLITLPATPKKSNTNGMFPFVWDGKEFFLYSILNDAAAHYMDGFAITESGAEEPIIVVPCTVATTNGYQANWLNAEVDKDGVTIYQYFPGATPYGHITVWRLTKEAEEMVYTVVGTENVFGTNWNPADENNDMVMGEDGVYTWSTQGVALYGDLEFKVVGNHDYSIYEWPMGMNNWVAHLPDGEAIYDILITFDPNAEDADRITCTLTKVGEVTPVEHVYTVAGTENLFGSNWDPTDADNDMVKGEDGVYTWTKDGVEFTDYATIEFKVVQDHAWTYAWPSSNWWAEITEPGKYNFVITFDPTADDANKITFTATRVDEEILRGDVDGDQQVNIADVVMLIDLLLNGDETPASADCNLDEAVNISDVTTLIDFLLSGNWPE